jgi:LacI family transcriptional regulator
VLSSRPHWLDHDLLLGVAHYAVHYGNWHLSTLPAEPNWVNRDTDSVAGMILRLHPSDPGQDRRVRDLPFDGPVVVIGTEDLSEGRPTVYWDPHAVGRVAADYLIQQGHQSFATIGEAAHAAARLRIEGFVQRIHQAGHHCEQLHPAGPERTDKWDRLLGRLPRPVGVFSPSDLVARVVLDHAVRLGIAVPMDMAVVGGSDERLTCELNRPRLSSVELPAHRVGFEAATLLARLMEGASAPAEPMLIPPGGVIERETSYLTAAEDAQVNQALQYIRDHSGQPIAVADVLRAVPLSRRALELRFKRATGHTLQKEIWRVHVNRARRLLVETDLPMPDVADRAGFADAQRMYEVFKRETGDSPTGYRQQRRSGRWQG